MKNMMSVVVVLGLMFLLTIMNLLQPSKESSELERRPLQQFPEFSIETITSGQFQEEFSEYVSDQFVARDFFRGIKTDVQIHLFQRVWHNDVFIVDGDLYDQFDEIDYDTIDTHIENINRFIATLDNNVYLTLVPSKAHGVKLPNIDQEMLAKYISVNVDAEYLDLFNYEWEDAFLISDPHWKQETAIDIYHNYLQEHLIKEQIMYDYVMNSLEEEYYGTLYSSLGTGNYYDKLPYYTNEVISNLEVCILSNNTCHQGPYLDVAEGESLYDIYLGGNEPIVVINNDAVEDRELVIFADSFGNSIAPIIAQDYSKVTIIDLRLVRLEFLDQFVDIGDADILYLYNIKSMNDDYRLTN